MAFTIRSLSAAFLVGLCLAGNASAQYIRLTTDNPLDNARLRSSGTTILTVTLDTNHDKNGTLQTCNSHAVTCGAGTSSTPLDLFSYTVTLRAVGGTVTWGAFSAADSNFTSLGPDLFSDTEVEFSRARPTVTMAGVVVLGTIPVTPLSGAPGIRIGVGPSEVNPFGFGTGFGTTCEGFGFANVYLLGDVLDPCGVASGIPGDWFDADAVRPMGNSSPTITAPSTTTGVEDTQITPIVATVTDPDAENTLTITQSGMPAFLSFESIPSSSPNAATISGTPAFGDAGVYAIQWFVDDGAGGTDSTTTTLSIARGNRAPLLTQPADMTVQAAGFLEQTLTATDPDGDALQFGIVNGPGYMSLVTTAMTGTIRLQPDLASVGTTEATVRATDGELSDDKSFRITVTPVPGNPPVLTQPSDMTLDEGAMGDQPLSAIDPDGNPLTFSLAAAPRYVTVSTTNPGAGTATGSVHVAPGYRDAGISIVRVRVSFGLLKDEKEFAITVNNVNTRPTLNQPVNMMVQEGGIADQVLFASDPEGESLWFTLVSGPTYATVTTVDPTRGNIHLAPGYSDAGTAAATVRASNELLSNDKVIAITVIQANRRPVLNAPSDMTVAQSGIADQTIGGADPDGDALTFAKVSGPTFMTVTTTGAATATIRLAADASEPLGTSSATVRVSDGNVSDSRSLTITVTKTNRAPRLSRLSDMSVKQGGRVGQLVEATDPDGDAVTFTKVSGPTFMTVTTTNATTGNIRLAAPSWEPIGTWTGAVRASDGVLYGDTSLTIMVTLEDRPVALAALADMSLAPETTADQGFAATDPDGDVIVFSSHGPGFMTRRDNVQEGATRTGTIHLAPAPGTTGSFSCSVSAEAGGVMLSRSFRVTVEESLVPGAGSKIRGVPNPFRSTTAIGFDVDQAGEVRLDIFDASGRLVRTLASGFMASGPHQLYWDGRSRSGSRVVSGSYQMRLRTPTRTRTSQLVLLK